ncbi:hypothetical protein [Blastococcus atacamensis]|uniref:hypothetical protein n=1 Tax=Blastococcus atacamensis TaxID=2070508 RepID=UPI0018E405BF|nr:hypothetical protein [Blastococcus atacamensis]
MPPSPVHRGGRCRLPPSFAPGWHVEMLDDGRLVVRTPTGVTRTTTPPGFWSEPEPEPEPPWLDETAPPDPMRC